MLSNSTKVRLYLQAQFNKEPYAVQFHQSQTILTSSIQPKNHMLSNSTNVRLYLHVPAQINQSLKNPKNKQTKKQTTKHTQVCEK